MKIIISYIIGKKMLNICDYCKEQIGINKTIYKGYDRNFCSISCRAKIIDNPTIVFPAPISTHIQRDTNSPQAILRKTKSDHIIHMNDNMDNKRTNMDTIDDEVIITEKINKPSKTNRLSWQCIYNQLLFYICIFSIYLYIVNIQ